MHGNKSISKKLNKIQEQHNKYLGIDWQGLHNFFWEAQRLATRLVQKAAWPISEA